MNFFKSLRVKAEELARDEEKIDYLLMRAVEKANENKDSLKKSWDDLAALLRLGGYRQPIVAVEHGAILQLDRLPTINRFARKLLRASGLWVGAVEVAVSAYMHHRLLQEWSSRRAICIPNGVDLDRFHTKRESDDYRRCSGEVVIACAARFVPGKGVDDLIRAFGVASLDQAGLYIAGDGPERRTLELLARSLQLEDRIRFLGPVLDMPAFWKSSDIAVVPSTQSIESFGMSAAEAMACGKPVVATRNGALPNIVLNGVTGRIVEPGDIGALAQALRAYAADPVLRSEHGSNGRRRCEERFSIKRTASSYLELCGELVAKRSGQKPWRFDPSSSSGSTEMQLPSSHPTR